MLSLLLAIIISASFSQRSLASPGLQSSLGIGTGGIDSYQVSSFPGYGYETRDTYGTPMYNLQYSYLTNPQRFSGFPHDVFVPGRVNPFSYPYRSSRSLNPSYYNRFYISSPNYAGLQTERALTPTSFQYSMDRYHPMPYFGSVTTYLIYNNSKPLDANPSRNISLESNTTSVKNISTDSLSVQKDPSDLLSTREDETSIKRERDLQMTYLGYMPSSALTSVSQDPYKRSSDGSNQLGVPFYPLRTDSEASNAQRSESSSPILLSPYRFKDNRLRQSFSNYQQNGFGFQRPVGPIIPQITSTLHNIGSSLLRPVVSPYGPLNNPPISSIPYSSITRPTIQYPGVGSITANAPYFRSNSPRRMTEQIDSPLPDSNNPLRYSRNSLQNNQNGYYLFDVQPLLHQDEPSMSTFGFGEAKSKMVLPISENGYYIKQDPKSAQYAHRSYETILPHGPTFPNLNFDRLYPTEPNNRNDKNSFDPGRQTIINPYGPEGLSKYS